MSAFERYLQQASYLVNEHFADTPVLAWWEAALPDVRARYAADRRNLEIETTLAALPRISDVRLNVDDTVRLHATALLSENERSTLSATLQVLHPWRKGPFELFAVDIDAEWRSDWKWRRVAPFLSPLTGRRVLDVGCGNAYYAWRMLAQGARIVVGLDPAWLALAQFRAMHSFLPKTPITLLPAGSEFLTSELQSFDTVFSMGVIYHRREPVAHLQELRRALRRGGQLVLETLVFETDRADTLIPDGRYARMRNVWSIPSPSQVIRWLTTNGFVEPRCVSLAKTTTDEQRTTAWMRNQPLRDFLDPNNSDLTIEGYPAPMRGVFIAEAV